MSNENVLFTQEETEARARFKDMLNKLFARLAPDFSEQLHSRPEVLQAFCLDSTDYFKEVSPWQIYKYQLICEEFEIMLFTHLSQFRDETYQLQPRDWYQAANQIFQKYLNGELAAMEEQVHKMYSMDSDEAIRKNYLQACGHQFRCQVLQQAVNITGQAKADFWNQIVSALIGRVSETLHIDPAELCHTTYPLMEEGMKDAMNYCIQAIQDVSIAYCAREIESLKEQLYDYYNQNSADLMVKKQTLN